MCTLIGDPDRKEPSMLRANQDEGTQLCNAIVIVV